MKGNTLKNQVIARRVVSRQGYGGHKPLSLHLYMPAVPRGRPGSQAGVWGPGDLRVNAMALVLGKGVPVGRLPLGRIKTSPGLTGCPAGISKRRCLRLAPLKKRRAAVGCEWNLGIYGIPTLACGPRLASLSWGSTQESEGGAGAEPETLALRGWC